MLDEAELKLNVEQYLKDKTDYAILVDGDWGTGKTFFIKNMFEIMKQNNEISNFNGAIYISLFGIHDFREIEDKIITSILLNTDKIKNKSRMKYYGKILSIVSNTFRNETDAVLSIIGEFQDLSKYIFIIDDLERSTLPTNNVLGFINRLCDNMGAKVIVIGNQIEIKINRYSNNIELRSIADSLMKKNFNLSNGESSDASRSENDNNYVSPKESIYLDDDYKLIKEKTFGHTYKFNPNLENVYRNLINSHFKDNDFLNVADLLKLTTKYNISNLRNIIKSINTFKFISSYLIESESNEITNKELKMLVFEYILYYTNESNDRTIIKIADDPLSKMLTNISSPVKYIEYFDFIKELVHQGTVSNFENNLNHFLEHLSRMNLDSRTKNLTQRLIYFIDYSDEEVLEDLENLKEIVKSGDFDPRYLSSIIETFRTLEYFDYLIAENYINIVKENAINQVKNFDEFYRSGRVSYDSELTERIDKEIDNFFEDFHNFTRRFDTDYKDEWIYDFRLFCQENRNIVTTNGLLSFLDIDCIYIWLTSASASYIGEFRSLILGYPLLSTSSSEIKMKYYVILNNLMEMLLDINRNDKTGRIQMEYLISNIKHLLNQLDQ